MGEMRRVGLDTGFQARRVTDLLALSAYGSVQAMPTVTPGAPSFTGASIPRCRLAKTLADSAKKSTNTGAISFWRFSPDLSRKAALNQWLGIRFALCGFCLMLAACQAPKGSFCAISSPIRMSAETVDRLTDAEVKDILAFNEKGRKLCGWSR